MKIKPFIKKNKRKFDISQISASSTPSNKNKQQWKNKKSLILPSTSSFLPNIEDEEEEYNFNNQQKHLNEEVHENPTHLEASMQEVVNNQIEFQNLDRYLDQYIGPTLKAYMVEFFSDPHNVIDKTYGPHYSENTLMLGRKKFDVDQNDNIVIDNKKIPATPGLLELIFKKNPNERLYNDEDLNNYKDLLELTKVYRRSYADNGVIKSNRGYKYRNIISKLITKIGKGIDKTKKI